MSEAEYVKTACQHCGGPIEFPKSALGVLETCPHCGKETRLGGTVGLSTTAKMLVVVWLLLVFGGFGTALYFYRNPPGSKPVGTTNTISATQKKPLLLNNFQISPVNIEIPADGGLVYAVGSLSNTTPEQRFGVKVEIDLLDENGTKIGSANDYVDLVEPANTWTFRALVTERSAASATVREITEK